MNTSNHDGIQPEERFLDGIAKFSDFHLRTVQSDRRLIDPADNEGLVEEFYDDLHDIRVIAVPGDSEIAKEHTRLLEKRLPVFSGFYTEEGILLMQVPLGTKPLSSMLPSVVRNPGSYKPIFREVGSILRKSIDAGLGVPHATPGHPLLRQFAFSLEEHAPNGGRIYLTPPYTFNTETINEEAVVQIYAELERFGFTDRERTLNLIEWVTQGMDGESR